MQREELKRVATSIVQLPDYFQPVIEEYFEGENGEGEAMYSWRNEEQDEDITINLDLAGNLTGLSMDRNVEIPETVPLNVEERRKHAESYLLSHYPDALNHLTFYRTKELTRAVRFYYEQMVMDLPLEHAGCFIDIDPAGNMIEFKYNGIKQTPEIPATLISKEKLIEHVQSRLDCQLKIINVNTSLHDVVEDTLRLVYEPKLFLMKYKADTLKATLTIEHEEEDAETYVSLPIPSDTIVRKDLSNEEIIGVTNQMNIIREVDMGDATGLVWRDRDWEMKEEDLSMDGFYMRHSEETVKAFISKETGKVKSFMWFKERSGEHKFSREACYHKAIEFLQKIVPDYIQYMQRIVRENEEDKDDTSRNESFAFHMHNGHGIPIQLNMVMVSINCTTGFIDHYSGPSFDLEQLSQVPTEPTVSTKEASEIIISHLDFELAWNKIYNSETESYSLAYQACDRNSRMPIRYIDAMTGMVICDKNFRS